MRSMISRSGIHSLGRMFTLTAVMLNLSFLRCLRSCLRPDLWVVLLNMADCSLRSSHFTLKYASSVMEKSWSDTCHSTGNTGHWGHSLSFRWSPWEYLWYEPQYKPSQRLGEGEGHISGNYQEDISCVPLLCSSHLREILKLNTDSWERWDLPVLAVWRKHDSRNRGNIIWMEDSWN